MISLDELRQMSPGERAELSRALATLDDPAPPAEANLPAGPRRRAIALAAIVGCCVVLAAWTAVLALTLPRYYRSGDWRGAWVGFDIGAAGHVRGDRLGGLAAPPAGDHLPGGPGHAAVLRCLVRRHPGPADQRVPGQPADGAVRRAAAGRAGGDRRTAADAAQHQVAGPVPGQRGRAAAAVEGPALRPGDPRLPYPHPGRALLPRGSGGRRGQGEAGAAREAARTSVPPG